MAGGNWLGENGGGPNGGTATRISGIAAALALAAGLLSAGPAVAGEVLVDFEDVQGPGWFPNDGPVEPYSSQGVTLTGGQVLTAVDGLVANQSSLYASAAACTGCSRIVTLDFAEPVSNLRLTLYNGTIFGLQFIVTDNSGRQQILSVGRHGPSGQTAVALPGGNIRRVTVRPRFAGSLFHNFFIDDIRFEVPDLNYTVSFSAFVPHDNVPGGPTAWCRPGTNGLPPGLLARGAPEKARARWLHDIAFEWPEDDGVEAQDDGHGRKHGHERGEAHGMPENPRGRPFHFDDEGDRGHPRRLYFAGDNRGFQADAPGFRLRQAVTVVPEQARDADGLLDGSVLNRAGEIRAYAADAMADGVIDAADDDGTANDCALFHKAYWPETDAMSVTVTRTGPSTVAVHLSGTLETPLAGPARVLGAIDWDLTVTVEKRGEQAYYTVSGAHDGFPAWELYINGAAIYLMDPGTPPYRFSRHTRKLLPPLDVRIAETSGLLR